MTEVRQQFLMAKCQAECFEPVEKRAKPAVEICVRVKAVTGSAGSPAEATRVYELTTDSCNEKTKNAPESTFQLVVKGAQLLVLGGVYRLTLTKEPT